jgi:hypothetical protein
MEKHEQVEVKIDEDFTILVDKGMEDIVKNFFHWDIETCNSCIDYRGSIWIEFCDFEDWKKFLQLTLRNNIKIKACDEKQYTLWDFLQEKVNVKLVYDEELMEDPNNEDVYMGTGVLVICVGLTFPNKYLDKFKKLFFEVLKPE